MTDNGCTVSVIGLGSDTDCDAAFLKDIADKGKGRVFFSAQPMDIPKIFAQEAVTIARSAFIKDPVGAKATGRWTEISPKPIDWPMKVDGYNLSYAREDATVSLISADEYLAPLVAHARRGLGRSMAVSFPLGGEYSESVRQWPQYGDFLQTIGRFLMGSEVPPGIALRHRLDGTRLTLDLLYDPLTWSEKLSMIAPKIRMVDDANPLTREIPWRRIAPGHFSVTQDLDEGSVARGAIQVGEHALPFGPLSVGTSAEWSFESERLAELRATSNLTGGRELLDLAKAWLRPPHVAETSLRLPLAVALIVLVLLEALVTRTDWKLPEFAMARAARRRTKAPQAKPRARAPEPLVPVNPVPENDPPETPTSDVPSERQSRFQRAKNRK
jgi:hypothetical protein